MRVLAFVGDDPGQKGATCLLGVLDDPDDKRHGEVVYCAVWDHALRKTDRGEHVDPVHFAQSVRRHAIETGMDCVADAMRHGLRVGVARVVIEIPRVGGRMFSADGVVTQGANYGIVLGAALCNSEFAAEVVEDADPAAGQWYAEAGAACPKGKDRKDHSIETAHALLALWCSPNFRVDISRAEAKNAWGLTPDRADALLLAHLGVLRWLGRAVVPANAGAAAKSKARGKAVRDHEVARAMEGVPRRMPVVGAVACPRCGGRGIGLECTAARTCRERTWAAAAQHKAGAPTLGLQDAPLLQFIDAMRGLSDYAIACERGVWRVVGPDGARGDRVSREALDAAIDAGLVRLTLDDRRRPVWVRRVAGPPVAGVRPSC